MTAEEFFNQAVKIFAAAGREINRRLAKRNKEVVTKALQSPADKQAKAHDDFHKFVRSL
ncbi:hypothetical protein [Limosilactobacillus antri]|uniref:hypothetical protein n=1 Tax=Limosilactobacillus antri TaxID=227943 RepID=UPI001F5A6B6E|nr:hypothetical protein [Limosilactobacillus antri]